VGFPIPSARHDKAVGGGELVGLRTYYADYGVLVSRPAPGGNMGVTIKAGGNRSHSHNDIGSFSIGLRDTQILGDPGGPSCAAVKMRF
jgi:hypothetical protein